MVIVERSAHFRVSFRARACPRGGIAPLNTRKSGCSSPHSSGAGLSPIATLRVRDDTHPTVYTGKLKVRTAGLRLTPEKYLLRRRACGSRREQLLLRLSSGCRRGPRPATPLPFLRGAAGSPPPHLPRTSAPPPTPRRTCG